MKFSTLALETVLLSGALAAPMPKRKPIEQDYGDKFSYNLIWSETFNDDKALYKPNPARWKTGTGKYFSPGEKDTNVKYVDMVTCVQVSDHKSLMLNPRKPPLHNDDGKWWSGKVETIKDFEARAGKKTLFEARLKIGDAPEGSLAGIWPRFYVISTDFWNSPVPWPRMGEWEILELKNGHESFVPTLHCGDISGGGPCKEPEGFNPGAGYTVSRGQWHKVGFEVDRSMCSKQENSECWREETVTWFLDGTARYKTQGTDLGDKDAWIRLFHQKVFMGFGLGVGGSRVGPPNNETTDGEAAGMDIDYVGVWESKWPVDTPK